MVTGSRGLFIWGDTEGSEKKEDTYMTGERQIWERGMGRDERWRGRSERGIRQGEREARGEEKG